MIPGAEARRGKRGSGREEKCGEGKRGRDGGGRTERCGGRGTFWICGDKTKENGVEREDRGGLERSTSR